MADNRIVSRQPRPEDIDDLAPRLRAADVEEIYASSGRNPHEALARAVRMSTYCFAIEIDGRIEALIGCAPLALLGGVGCPWFVGSDKVDSLPKAICEYGGYLIDLVTPQFPTLLNYVDARHTKAQRWLKWLGFTLDAPAPHGPYSLPFRRFHMGLNE